MLTFILLQILFAAISILQAKQEALVISHFAPVSTPGKMETRSTYGTIAQALNTILMALFICLSKHWWLLALLPLVRVLAHDLVLNVSVWGWKYALTMRETLSDFYISKWLQFIVPSKYIGLVKFVGAAILLIVINSLL